MVLFAYVLSGVFWIILFLLITPYLDTIIATGYALYAFLWLLGLFLAAIVLPCFLLIELVKERNALRKKTGCSKIGSSNWKNKESMLVESPILP